MKLAPVLAQYLATHKVLNLPGLGTFHAESTYNPEVDYNKKGTSLLNISFEQTKVSQPDEALIAYLSQETGKMKILAESDLLSQIEGAISFLNTGKPYFLAGIGTLTKKMDGNFEFHKEKFIHTEKEKKKAIPITEKNSVPHIDETSKPRKAKPAAIIGAVCLIAVAAVVWFYTQNKEKNDGNIEDVTAAINDSVAPSGTGGVTTAAAQPANAATTASDVYKYILEIARQPRASKRFNQLKTIKWPIEMETADSVSYKLFIKLPAANADTTRVKDSLSALSGRKVWIER